MEEEKEERKKREWIARAEREREISGEKRERERRRDEAGEEKKTDARVIKFYSGVSSRCGVPCGATIIYWLPADDVDGPGCLLPRAPQRDALLTPHTAPVIRPRRLWILFFFFVIFLFSGRFLPTCN